MPRDGAVRDCDAPAPFADGIAQVPPVPLLAVCSCDAPAPFTDGIAAGPSPLMKEDRRPDDNCRIYLSPPSGFEKTHARRVAD